MKTLSFLVTAALVGAAYGASKECTMLEMLTLKNSATYKAFQAADCTLATAQKAGCKESTCVKSLEAVIAILPSCTVDGEDPKVKLTGMLTEFENTCEGGKTPLPLSSENIGSWKLCSSKELEVINTIPYIAKREQVCESPMGTDPAVAAKKNCSKECFAVLEADLAIEPNCTMGGTPATERELFASMIDDIKSACRKKNLTSDSASASLTLAPAPAPSTTPAAGSASPTIAPASASALTALNTAAAITVMEVAALTPW